jgi:hypothetical protein
LGQVRPRAPSGMGSRRKWLLTSQRVSPGEPSSLFLISVESGERRRLTSPPQSYSGDLAAGFSSDGSTLAFSRTQTAAMGKLCLVAMSGGFATAGEPSCFSISDGRLANFSSLRWIPDKRELMFSPLFRGITQPSLWRMAVPAREGDVGVLERLPVPSDGARDLAISRDGRRLVYSNLLVDADIWRLQVQKAVPPTPGATASSVKLISSTQYDWGGRYSPDGERIVFLSNRSGRPAVWVAAKDGSTATQLTARSSANRLAPLGSRWSAHRLRFDAGTANSNCT